MKRVFLYCLSLLLISGTAYADSFQIDNSYDFKSPMLVGWGETVDWTHTYSFEVELPSITSANLTLGLMDDGGCFDMFELAVGWTEGVRKFWIGEVDTGEYSYSLAINGLDDGIYKVFLRSLFGDFYVASSRLVIDYTDSGDTGAVPVPEPASMLLFGAGLIGLAGTFRKKLLKK